MLEQVIPEQLIALTKEFPELKKSLVEYMIARLKGETELLKQTSLRRKIEFENEKTTQKEKPYVPKNESF